MRRIQLNPCAWILAVALLALPVAAGAASGDFATLSAGGDAVVWQVQGDYEAVTLRVAGPGGVSTETFAAGQMPQFSLFDRAGSYLADGGYNWELTVTPRIDAATRRLMNEARRTGDTSALAGRIPERRVQSGYFTIRGGSVVSGGEEEAGAASAPARTGGDFEAVSDGALTPITDRTVISGDLTVYNSLCVGSDCATAENYGADSIRLKENNLRIHFDDTSNSASFPNTDWRIEANESANGGANWFTINDASNGRRSFTIEASAPTNAMYLDDGGRLGLGTMTPVVELHVVDGDSPTLRLEQDGSSGFTPQIWDVAGNEANFFVRDATNGSQLPFKIKPGADHNSLVIDSDNDVGIGILSPEQKLHVQNGTVLIRSTSSTDNAAFTLENTAGTNPQLWVFQNQSTNGSFNVTPNSSGTQAPLKVFPGAPENSLVIGQNGGGTSPRVGIHRVSSIQFPLQVGTDATNGNGAHVTDAGVWTNGSSRVNKTDIVDLSGDDAMAAFTQLTPVRYKGINSSDDEEYMGFIAEDVPELVAMKDRKGLAAMDVVAVLTKVVQLQQQRLEQLEAALAAQQAAQPVE